MSYTLKGLNKKEFSFNHFVYPLILTGAKKYGWEPMGVYLGELQIKYFKLPDVRYGKGDIQVYLSNGHQRIEKKDALNLKVALEKALSDDYAFNEERLKDKNMIKNIFNFFCNKKDTEIFVTTFTKEEMQKQVKEFIKFLGKCGGFITT
jgi:hypothetical protein